MRHGLPPVVAHVKLQQIFGARAILGFRFNIHLPLPPEPGEIVHEISAHERLQRGVNVAERNAEFQHLVPVHFDEHLRHVGQIRREQPAQFGPLPRRRHELVQVLREKGRILAAGAVFQDERKAAGSADAGNGRRGKGHHLRLGDFGQGGIEVRLDGRDLFVRLFPFGPRLEGHKKEGVVGGLHLAQQD